MGGVAWAVCFSVLLLIRDERTCRQPPEASVAGVGLWPGSLAIPKEARGEMLQRWQSVMRRMPTD